MPGIVGVFSSDEIYEGEDSVPAMCDVTKHMPNQKITNYQYANLLLGRVDSAVFYKNIKPKETETVIVFICGELLNSQKERREILRNSFSEEEIIEDIDFLIGLYNNNKSDFANHLRGSFNAFVIDKRNKRLIIVNDRFGLRPLYYHRRGNRLVFASEVKAILKYDGIRRNINLAGLADFFHFGFLTGDKTFFTEIEMLPPSTVLTFENRSLKMRKYWDLTFVEERSILDKNDCVDQLANAIKDSVKANVEGDFRFGLPLSGGLDSRTIAACVPKEKYPLLVYTWGMPNSPEVQIAKKVTDKLGLEQHNLQRTPEQFVENFQKSVVMTDGMIPGNLPLANFLFEEAFMSQVDICLDGLQSISVMLPLGHGLSSDNDIINRLFPATPQETLKIILPDYYYKTFNELASVSIENIKNSTHAVDPINRYHYFDITQNQRRDHNFGHLVKRNFVEIRTPLFDYPVVDMVRRIPSSLRTQRYIYYKTFCLISPELAKIKNLGSMFPINYAHWLHTLGRIKKGLKTRIYSAFFDGFGIKYDRHALSDWGIDYDAWYKDSSVVKNFINQILTEENIKDCEYLDPKGVTQILDAQFNGKQNHAGIINRLLTHVIWSKTVSQTD